MSVYDVDYNKVSIQLLPPDKRFKVMAAWVQVLLKSMQWVHDLWINDFRTGSSASLWVNSTVYKKYDRVLYKGSVYESLIANNTDNPLTVTSWMLVQVNFIGIAESILYNGNVLVLTYAMNKWFGTVFRQPNNQSDIYITNNALTIPVFRVATIEVNSSKVYTNTSSEYVVNASNFTVPANFTIHCPVAVYNALDTTLVNNDKIFRNFVNKYVPAGITYTIVTY